MDVNEKFLGGGRGGGGGGSGGPWEGSGWGVGGGGEGGPWMGSGWGGGQGGCERRIEVFVKIQKKNCLGGGVRLGGGGWVGMSGSGWGVRVDVNEELKFL